MKRILPLFPLLFIFSFTQAQNTALQFDGTNDYVIAPAYVVPNSGDFTVELWVYSTDNSSVKEFVSQGSSGDAFYIGTNGTAVRCGDKWMSTGVTMPMNQWVHVALVKTGSAAALYLNGVQKATLASGYSISAAGTHFQLATQYGGIGEYFQGRLDELRIWNVARTAADIKAGMYGTVATNSAGLVAYYKMNEASGTVLGNGTATPNLNGTLTNGPIWTVSPVQAANNTLSFDGNDYLTVPYASSLEMSNTLTLEAWVYPANGNWMNIIMKGAYGYGLSLSGSANADGCNVGNKLVYWDQSYCGYAIKSTLTYTQKAWHHVAVTVNDIGSQLELYFYLDGVQDGPYYSNITSIDNGGASSNLFIGMQGLGCPCNFVTGKVDEVRIWNTARTASEIQTNKDLSLTGNEAGLAAYYNFNQGISAGDNTGLITAIDGTSNNNHATLNGFALNGTVSNWVDSTSVSVLPVHISRFDVSAASESVLLKWTTASEQNSREFMVERSSDGHSFSTIATLPARGNSNSQVTYTYNDAAPLAGRNYYRLKQVDMDGAFNYTAIKAVDFQRSNRSFIQVYPNPVQDECRVMVSTDKDEVLTLHSSERTVKRIEVKKGTHSFVLDMKSLAPGVYYLKDQQGRAEKILKL